jgi:hypothetical protein
MTTTFDLEREIREHLSKMGYELVRAVRTGPRSARIIFLSSKDSYWPAEASVDGTARGQESDEALLEKFKLEIERIAVMSLGRGKAKWPSSLGLVLFLEGEHWVVQVLGLDVATQGRTPFDALRAAAEALEAQVLVYEELGKDVFEVMKPAPEPYWRLAAARGAEELAAALAAVERGNRPYVDEFAREVL